MACGQTRIFNVTTGSQGWRFEGNPRGWHVTTHEESIDPTLGYQKTVFKFLTIANEVFADFLKTRDEAFRARFAWYSLENFKAALGKHFAVIEELPSYPEPRVLLVCSRTR